MATLEALPYLQHLDSVPSTWYSQHTSEVLRRFGKENGYRIPVLRSSFFINEQHLAFEHDIRHHLNKHIYAKVSSLRLTPQVISSVTPTWSQHLQHLRHLHLECLVEEHVSRQSSSLAKLLQAAQSWNAGFERLRNLQTLTLSGGGGFDFLKDRTDFTQDVVLYREPFHLGDLLRDCYLPHLRSLTLTDWPVTEAGMICMIDRHSSTLQTVRLERLSLFDQDIPREHGCSPEYWYIDHSRTTCPVCGAFPNIESWLRVAKSFGSCERLLDISFENLICHFFAPAFVDVYLRIEDIKAMYQEVWQNCPR